MTSIHPVYEGLKVGVNAQELLRLIADYKTTASDNGLLSMVENGYEHWAVIAAQNNGVLPLTMKGGGADGRPHAQAPYPLTSMPGHLRPAFGPTVEDHMVVELDWSASHWQLLAFQSGDDTLVEDIRKGDFYTTQFPGFADPDPEQAKKNRKMIKLSMLAYLNGGRKPACISNKMTEAQADSFLTTMQGHMDTRWPKAKAYLNTLRDMAVKEGWVSRDRRALGAGTALMHIEAHNLVKALTHKKLEDTSMKVIIPMHDGVVISAHKDEVQSIARKVARLMVAYSTGSLEEAKDHTDDWLTSVISESWTGTTPVPHGRDLRLSAVSNLKSDDLNGLIVAASVMNTAVVKESKTNHHSTPRGRVLRDALAAVEAAAEWQAAKKVAKLNKVVKGMNDRYTYLSIYNEVYDSEHGHHIQPDAFKKESPAKRAWMSAKNDGKRATARGTVVDPKGKKMVGPNLNVFDPTEVYLPANNPTNATTAQADLSFILDHLVNTDEDKQYILQWMAYALKNMDKRQVALVFHGAKGTGKGSLLSMMRGLFGKYARSIRPCDLETHFNGWVKDCFVALADEVVAEYMKEKRSTSNNLKTLITESRIIMEKKGKDAEEVSNRVKWIFCSNADKPVLLEEGDRRYSVFYSSQTIPKNEPVNIPARIERMVDSKDAAYWQELADYLGTIDLTNYDPWTVHENAARHALISSSMAGPRQWWKDLADDIPNGTYTTTDLHEIYLAEHPADTRMKKEGLMQYRSEGLRTRMTPTKRKVAGKTTRFWIVGPNPPTAAQNRVAASWVSQRKYNPTGHAFSTGIQDFTMN